jgi:ABC-2 type transport system permease protein
MSTVTAATTRRTTTAAGRLRALARAELTLLGRNRTTVFMAVFVPLVLPLSVRQAVERIDLAALGLTMGGMMLTAAIGLALVFSVYSSLVTVFVTRREDLVLKRLRTGELGDAEIFAGTALPALGIGVTQAAVVSAGCVLLLDAGAPEAPHLVVLGLLFGLLTCATFAALTAAVSRTTESAQVTALPMVLVSILGSGISFPTGALPDLLDTICGLLPLSPAITLIRDGWAGSLSGPETLRTLCTAVVWVVISVLAVRRWFRWEPRH